MTLRLIPNPIGRLGSTGAMQPVGAALSYLQRLKALTPIAYWPLNEAAGTSGAGSVLDASGNSRNATPTGITFGATGIGDGLTAASFDGSTSRAILSGTPLTSFNAAFTPGEFTILMWLKAVTLGLFGRALFIADAGLGTYISIHRTAGNFVQWVYLAGGVNKNVLHQPADLTLYHHVAMTVSKSGDALKTYLDGVQVGTTQTGLGTWSGAVAYAVLGAQDNTPANPFKGSLQHIAVVNGALSDAAILAASVYHA